jgi:hypothetical protein
MLRSYHLQNRHLARLSIDAELVQGRPTLKDADATDEQVKLGGDGELQRVCAARRTTCDWQCSR